MMINYTTLPGDSRNGGSLIASHTIEVNPAPAYRDELEAVHDAVMELLRDVLEDWSGAVLDDPEQDAADRADPDKGMGE